MSILAQNKKEEKNILGRKKSLPSGSYRVQAYDFTDGAGKRHYRSFTAPSLKEAKSLREAWKLTREAETPARLTVKQAIRQYVDVKKAVLSPSTLREYERLYKTRFSDSLFGGLLLNQLTSQRVQSWVSDLAREVSPKSVRNIYGLFVSALDMFAPDKKIRVQLPAKKQPGLHCPSDDEVKRLLEVTEGDPELYFAVLLAAFGPLRRGEICALDPEDFDGSTVSVTKSKVKGPNGSWSTKQPKTIGSYRKIILPDFVLDARVQISCSPDAISRRFQRAVILAGLPHFRFHDLRHYSASIMHAIGIPDQYIMQRGGWSTDGVMKTVYRNAIPDEAIRQNAAINQHFEQMQHEMQHEPRKMA